MIGTTQLIFIGIAIFILFGGAIFTRFAKQLVTAKKEVNKTIKQLEENENTTN